MKVKTKENMQLLTNLSVKLFLLCVALTVSFPEGKFVTHIVRKQLLFIPYFLQSVTQWSLLVSD